MNLQHIKNNEEFLFYKETDKNGPHVLVVPQNYPSEIYVDNNIHNKKKMPFTITVYIGGLSVIGLYIVYRMLQKSSRY